MKRILTAVIMVILQIVLCSVSAFAAVDRDKEIREAVTAFVTARTTGMGWDVKLRRLSILDNLKLPEGNLDYEIIAPQQWEGWGNANLAVVVRKNDRTLRNIQVRIDVEALAESVVSLRQIDHGSVINAADVTLQKREIAQNYNLTAKAVDEVIGRKARTTIRANQVVRSDQTEKIPLIKSGQLVTIIAENSILKVSVAGIAHSSGAEGDIVRVQNLTSLKEIPAKVIDANTVQIAF